MPSYTYTAQQLLSLRDRTGPVTLENVPLKGASHGEQAWDRKPPSSESHAIQSQLRREPATQTGSLVRQIGGESRTLGRFHKFKAFHTQQHSSGRPKLDLTSAPEDVAFVRQYARRDTADSSSTKMEWRYRGRTGSEAVNPVEPLSAPTGINAQQIEGFQRFYKAVISPTHVRVTAGGRIVPNTRGTSPVSKQVKDKIDDGKHAKDSAQQAGGHDQGIHESESLAVPEASSIPQFAFPPLHPLYPPFHTSMPGYPMIPLPVGLGIPTGAPESFPNSHQLGLPRTNFSLAPPEVPKAPAKENLKAASFGNSNSLSAPAFGESEDKDRQETLEKLDRPNPLLTYGQALYHGGPPAMHSYILPASQTQFTPGYLAHPGFLPSAFQGALMGQSSGGLSLHSIPSLGFPAMPMPFPLSHAHMNQAGSLATSNMTTHLQSVNSPLPPMAPAISSIRPSEISRKQIEMLRGSLKYHQDQLLYNRHQIDEKDMEHTVQMLQSQIDRFEILNQSQLQFEENHYPKKEAKVTESLGPHLRGSNRGSQTNTSYPGTVKHASGSTRRSESFRHKQSSRRRESAFNLFPMTSGSLLTGPVKKSTLPSRAALAPPFEPRFDFSKPRFSVSRDYGSLQWDGTAYDEGAPATRLMGEGTVTESGQSETRSSSLLFRKPNAGEPYLIGSLPAGINPEVATEADYIFERELTQNEARSRFLFLGRAPSFTRRGLPKFDGRNFYPASPKEETDSHVSPDSSTHQRVNTIGANIDSCTGNTQAKSAPISQPCIPGQYASDFRRERQKPVKVTLRRPDSDSVAMAQSIKDSSTKSPSVPTISIGKSGKTDKMRRDNSRTKFMQTVLKRNITSNSEVLPSALTSATAQAVLPQYSTGYESLVAASLSSNNTSPVAIGLLSPIKSDDGSCTFTTPTAKKVGENRPPLDSVGIVSLEQRFRCTTQLESRHNTAISSCLTGL